MLISCQKKRHTRGQGKKRVFTQINRADLFFALAFFRFIRNSGTWRRMRAKYGFLFSVAQWVGSPKDAESCQKLASREEEPVLLLAERVREFRMNLFSVHPAEACFALSPGEYPPSTQIPDEPFFRLFFACLLFRPFFAPFSPSPSGSLGSSSSGERARSDSQAADRATVAGRWRAAKTIEIFTVASQ